MAKSPHERMLEQLELDLTAVQPHGGERIDASFLHRSFCAAGLPVSRPKDPIRFDRYDDAFSLNILSPERTLPGGKSAAFGVPWGPRARVLILWMSTQARDPKRGAGDRWLEIPSINSWIPSLGIPHSHAAEKSLKEQLVKLAFSQFSMFLKNEDVVLLHDTKLIESVAFTDSDIEAFLAGQIGKVRWPLALRLSEQAFSTFRSPKAIPIPTHRLATISDSALAIDAFMYLCYRLPELAEQGTDASEMVGWRRLVAQFGKHGQAPSKFRELFLPALKDALGAYPEAAAGVEVTDEGLLLRGVELPALARSFIAVPPLPTPAKRRKVRNRNAATAAPAPATNTEEGMP
ncbi:replication initiation protein [Azospirillum canadense]|uniref:replication protein RepA n=1 Tax=Azospirillum canadense TaxID=403962 RepID=UPI002226FA58|nr:replication protein RepA [Azospirillum canadense]MCW2241855.1 hypothetical protein [Azospirillum canadense]